jgi:hypothetical protein
VPGSLYHGGPRLAWHSIRIAADAVLTTPYVKDWD